MNIEPPGNGVFSQIMDDYLAQLAAAWDASRFEALGAEVKDDEALLPFYGRTYRVSTKGVWDFEGREPHHAVKVVLVKYLLTADPKAPEGAEWVAYKQFPDAAPYVEGFANTVERRISKAYGDKAGELAKACQVYQPRPPSMELSYDVILELPALPLVPVLLLFNEEDGPFPASCALLFRDNAPAHLDMECLAIIGQVLAAWLCREKGSL